jgi:hypothetical protein
MDLADLIEPKQVVFGARADTKEKLLLDLASRAAAFLNLDPKLVFNALQAREQLGSTDPFRLGRRQARGSCFSPPDAGDGPRRAPRRARRRLETPARQGTRR